MTPHHSCRTTTSPDTVTKVGAFFDIRNLARVFWSFRVLPKSPADSPGRYSDPDGSHLTTWVIRRNLDPF